MCGITEMENNDAASLYGNAPYSPSTLTPLPNTRDPQLNPDSLRHVDTPALHAGRSPSDPYDQLPMMQPDNAIQPITTFGQSTVYARTRVMSPNN